MPRCPSLLWDRGAQELFVASPYSDSPAATGSSNSSSTSSNLFFDYPIADAATVEGGGATGGRSSGAEDVAKGDTFAHTAVARSGVFGCANVASGAGQERNGGLQVSGALGASPQCAGHHGAFPGPVPLAGSIAHAAMPSNGGGGGNASEAIDGQRGPARDFHAIQVEEHLVQSVDAGLGGRHEPIDVLRHRPQGPLDGDKSSNGVVLFGVSTLDDWIGPLQQLARAHQSLRSRRNLFNQVTLRAASLYDISDRFMSEYDADWTQVSECSTPALSSVASDTPWISPTASVTDGLDQSSHATATPPRAGIDSLLVGTASSCQQVQLPPWPTKPVLSPEVALRASPLVDTGSAASRSKVFQQQCQIVYCSGSAGRPAHLDESDACAYANWWVARQRVQPSWSTTPSDQQLSVVGVGLACPPGGQGGADSLRERWEEPEPSSSGSDDGDPPFPALTSSYGSNSEATDTEMPVLEPMRPLPGSTDADDDPVESWLFPTYEPDPVFSKAQRAVVLLHLLMMYRHETDPSLKHVFEKTVRQAISEYTGLCSSS